ncbi:MAG: TIGR00730 family Rossman fold protein [Campylobacter sp.]|nr:TIGR00730 family Rossman fold protein [Campylobacter sp.]
MTEFIHEFESFKDNVNFSNKAVTFFGSARVGEDSLYYKMARELSFKLGNSGFAVITGGGDGIMAAANKGAYESGKSPSIGFNIRLPFEQKTNSFITQSYLFSHFSPRKFALIYSSIAFVVFPGGFGTLDELGEVLVLVQNKLLDAKIFLVGEKFWSGLDEFIKTSLAGEKMISAKDLEIYTISDDIDFIAKQILKI